MFNVQLKNTQISPRLLFMNKYGKTLKKRKTNRVRERSTTDDNKDADSGTLTLRDDLETNVDDVVALASGKPQICFTNKSLKC